MRYLVTGGAGFIGYHLVGALLEYGHKVTVLDNLSTGKMANLYDAAHFVEGDICVAEDVKAAFSGIDGCFHLAAIASVGRSIEDWANVHITNQSGTIRIFEHAANSGIPVVYASSAAVYGDNSNLPLTEDSETQPLSPYGLDKLACEWQANMGYKIKGLSSIGLRFFNVYGDRQDPKSPYSGVISIFMEACKNQQAMQIFGDGEQTRDFIYVYDVVRYMINAMEYLHQNAAISEVVNICTGKSTSIKEIAMFLSDICRNSNAVKFLPQRHGDIRYSVGSPAKAETMLQIRAETALEDGLRQVWQKFCLSAQ